MTPACRQSDVELAEQHLGLLLDVGRGLAQAAGSGIGDSRAAKAGMTQTAALLGRLLQSAAAASTAAVQQRLLEVSTWDYPGVPIPVCYSSLCAM